MRGYDYSSPGSYFITLVAYRRECLFGQIDQPEMNLNSYGEIVKKTLSKLIVRGFKSFSARRINNLRKMVGVPVWQRSFYDHIVRSETEMRKIWDYIVINPQVWQDDEFN